MKKFLYFLLKMSLCFVTVFSLLVSVLLFFPANVYDTSYQAVIQRKFDVLKQTEGKKIIIVGGSNASFGIDEEKIEAETGYAVANLGLHAGFGAIVPTELSKANIGQGDIVLLAYEWGWQGYKYFETFGTDLVISGFDDRLDMYYQLPAKHYSKLIGYLMENFKKKLQYQPPSGVYSAEAFDEKGRMIYQRPETCLVYEGNEDTFGRVDVGDGTIADDVVEYLTEYKRYVEAQGAKVYFVAPPVYEGAITGSEEGFAQLLRNAEEQLGISYISNPADYFFPNEWIYDTPYHCTTVGEQRRTELLIADLKKVL